MSQSQSQSGESDYMANEKNKKYMSATNNNNTRNNTKNNYDNDNDNNDDYSEDEFDNGDLDNSTGDLENSTSSHISKPTMKQSSQNKKDIQQKNDQNNSPRNDNKNDIKDDNEENSNEITPNINSVSPQKKNSNYSLKPPTGHSSSTNNLTDTYGINNNNNTSKKISGNNTTNNYNNNNNISTKSAPIETDEERDRRHSFELIKQRWLSSSVNDLVGG